MPALTSFFLPKKRHFGLSISRSSLRAVEIDEHNRVKSAAEVVLPENLFAEGALVDKPKFIAALSKLLAVGKFTTNYVSVCFSEAYAFSRSCALPLIPMDEVREALSWRVKDLFPFPQEEIYFDWKLIQTTEKEQQLTVVAVQKKVLDSLVESLISVGLKPISFQPGAAAISKLLILRPQMQAFIVEINHRSSYITLVEGEKTLFTTVVNFTSSDTPDSYLQSIHQTLSDMVSFYTGRKILKTNQFPIIVTGELANEEWAKRLGTMISYPVKILKTQIQNGGYNKAYAAASTKVAPPTDEFSINLLPENIQSRYDAEMTDYFYKTLLLRISVMLVIFNIASLSIFLAITLERQRFDSQVKTLSSRVNTQKSDTQNLLKLNARAKNIVALSPLRKSPADKIALISLLLPQTLTISQWEYDDAKLTYLLKGEAQDRADLLDFKADLEKRTEFAKINLPLESLVSPKNVKFSISFIVSN